MPPAELMHVQDFLLTQKCTCAIISCNFFEIHDIIFIKLVEVNYEKAAICEKT